MADSRWCHFILSLIALGWKSVSVGDFAAVDSEIWLFFLFEKIERRIRQHNTKIYKKKNTENKQKHRKIPKKGL